MCAFHGMCVVCVVRVAVCPLYVLDMAYACRVIYGMVCMVCVCWAVGVVCVIYVICGVDMLCMC